MEYKKFLVVGMLCLSAMVQAKDITITRLTCEMQDGLVVTAESPRLGWQMISPENGTRQTAYEIEISDILTGNVVWNSNKVNSEKSQLIPTELPAGYYTWRVRVWDEVGVPSPWSHSSDFRIVSTTRGFCRM